MTNAIKAKRVRLNVKSNLNFHLENVFDVQHLKQIIFLILENVILYLSLLLFYQKIFI